MTSVNADEVVDRGISFLRETQLPSGEFPSYATPLDKEPDWQLDANVFVTALTLLALERLGGAGTGSMESAGRAFLRGEAGRSHLWRYWTHDHERYGFIPQDADDTACCSLALGFRGGERFANVRLLLANRDSRGRFFTWFVPHSPLPRSWRYWRVLWREVPAMPKRVLFWRATEARRTDVDVVVNAHVIRYLGPDAPLPALAFVRDAVRAGDEGTADSWHRSPFTLYHAVADGARRGVRGYGDAVVHVADHIAAAVRDDGGVGDPIDTAHAALALYDLRARPEVAVRLTDHLLATQRSDGSWDRSIFYYGGPKEVFGWGSEALTTATAIAAVAAGH